MSMARPARDEEDEKPLDPAVEKVRRKLVRFVVINLGILFLALMVVVLAVVYKSRRAEPAADAGFPASGEVIEADIPLPVGARIVSQSLSGSRIAIDVELAGGGRAILLYDLAERRLMGRYAMKPE
jgi:hypothetical protein